MRQHQEQRKKRACHQHRPMRKVQDIVDVEDEREAERKQHLHRPAHDPVQDLLRKQVLFPSMRLARLRRLRRQRMVGRTPHPPHPPHPRSHYNKYHKRYFLIFF